ncbi:MAG: DUF2846 domain-containing protein [Lysobacterales bacterium]
MSKHWIFAALTALAIVTASPVAVAKKPSQPNTIELAAPAEGKAQIVFFRPKKFAGSAVGFIVREGEAELGKLRNGNYFVASVEPGKHVYTVHSEAKDELNVELESGETLFAKGTINMGILAGRPNLSPSSEAEFRAAKLKPSKPLKKKRSS